MPWLVGATAGLVSVQFQNVNAFTFVTVIWFISVIRRPSRHRNSLFLVPLCVLPVAATVVTGDLVSNPLLAVQLLAFAANAAMIYAKSTEDDSRLMLRGLLHVCTIGAIVGLLQVTGALDYGVWHYPGVSYFGRPSGIYPEPDWLGMFGGIGALLAWRTMKLSTGRYIVLAINLSVFILAYARAAWVGLVFAIAMYALVSLYRARGGEGRRGRVVQGVVFLGVLSALTFAFAPPSFQTDLASRASSIVVRQPDDISSQARTRQYDGLVRLIASAPWYGHGISASGRVGVWGAYDQNSSNGVGTNWILCLWVDAGFLAIPLIGLFLFSALRGTRTLPGQILLFLIINNFFSNSTFFPIIWLVLGLTLANLKAQALKARIDRREPNEGEEWSHCQNEVGLNMPI